MRHAAAEFLSRPRWTIADARAALSALDDSRLSVAAFAVREGLDPQRLYMWRRRFRAAGPKSVPAFVEVHAATAASLEVVLRAGHTVRVPPSFDATALRRLLEVLDEVSGAC
jgi:transposase-like protein